MITFDDLRNRVFECDDAAQISAEVERVLDGLNPEHVFLVHRLAKYIAAGIEDECRQRTATWHM
jgi:hypothetical protein